MRKKTYVKLFGWPYQGEIELFSDDGRRIPVEVKYMRQGWEPNQAIGQAIIFSRVNGAGKAIGACFAVERASERLQLGSAERLLRDTLWEKLGIRLCVRKA